MNKHPQPPAGLLHTIASFLVFLFPFTSLITFKGVSLASFGFLLLAIGIFPQARAALVRTWCDVRWVVLAFGANLAYALILYFLRDGAQLSSCEKPSRMFFSMTAMLVVLALKPGRKMFWWGVVGGALGGAAVVAYQYVILDQDRPGGPLNAITFGDLALLLAMMAVAAATELRTVRHAAVLGLGAVAGLTACVLSGTRGAWLALVVGMLVFLAYGRVVRNRFVLVLAVVVAAATVVAFAVPDSAARERASQGIAEVRDYLNNGVVNTNVGTRLELWKAGAILAAEHPLFGQEPAVYRARMEQLAAQHRIDPVILPLPHFQNDAIQALVVGGAVGLLAWIAIIVAPLAFFVRELRLAAGRSRQRIALALAGLVVVASFVSFGLTEVIFWSVGGSLFYSLSVFLLMGFCLNLKEADGK
ncbi:MAG TPA: O-antigen ligase family protein [Telluria sp.]|nr:O-antigen ligase family protein [Telluria sp.]